MMSKAGKFATYLGVVLVSLYVLFPIYLLLLFSFLPINLTLQAKLPHIFPSLSHVTLYNFQYALFQIGLFEPLTRSLIVALLVAGMALLMGIPAGYGLSKLPNRTANMISTTLFLANMLPAITIAIPISVEFVKIGLWETIPGLAFAQELIVLPLTVFLILGAFQGLPKDLENQARVDGAGIWQVLSRILIPLSLGGIVAAFLLSFMMSWDEFTFAIILSPSNQTLPVKIFDNIFRGPVVATTAFALIATIPVLILTIFLSKFLKAEYLSGGLVG